jgi:hypothetical protein
MITNLTCYFEESTFIDNVMQNNLSLAKRYAFDKRFIDDQIRWDNLPYPDIFGMELQETIQGNTVQFLGSKINRREDNSLRWI